MFSILDCQSNLNLSTKATKKINHCVQYYAKPFSLKSILYRIRNAILHIFNQSEWQKCRTILVASLSVKYLKKQHSQMHILAEFILCYLVMRHKGIFVELLHFNSLIQRVSINSKKPIQLNLKTILIDLRKDKRELDQEIKNLQQKIQNLNLENQNKVKVMICLRNLEGSIRNFRFSKRDPAKKLYESLKEIKSLKFHLIDLSKKINLMEKR